MSPQATIGHYRITSKLGEGGMGEVYLAHDDKLGRDVALKVLPETFAQDPERLARFTREAQVLASLNHPNIAAIYGVEARAIVLELVDGVTLAERVVRGAMAPDEARPVIEQLIDALEYAHNKGVIHRDLKPANIKLTPEGRVKVLDFGLAKALGGESAVADPISSPTLTMRATAAGVIMGTAAYMSPEQARGQSVDKQADIWAFGVVVYELLTGRQLFGGQTVADTLAAVLKETPDLDLVPNQMRELVRHCLAKDPRRRMRDIGDARILLSALPVASAAPQPASRPALLWIVMACLAGLSAVLGYRLWRAGPAPERPLLRFSVDLGPEAVASRDMTVVISPDGTRIVYPIRTGNGTRLALRYMGQLKGTPLIGTENGNDAFFSPDGEWVGFGGGGKVKKVSVHGGSPVTLCDGQLRGASWGNDGFIFATLGQSNGVSRIPENGGAPKPVTKIDDKKELTHRWPQILPGGEWLLFSSNMLQSNWEGANVEAVSLKNGERKVIERAAFFGRYLPTGHLLFVQRNTLYGVRFDLDHLETKGTPAPLVEDLAASSFGGGQFDISRDGTLVYLSGPAPDTPTRSVLWLDAGGKLHPVLSGALAGGTNYHRAVLSPDGKRMAIAIGPGSGDLWIYDLEREAPTKITFTNNVLSAVWAPDGKHLVYGLIPGLDSGLRWVRADGAGEPKPLLKSSNIQTPVIPYSFSPDGRYLVYGSGTVLSNQDIFSLGLDGTDGDEPRVGQTIPLLNGPFTESGGAISPDGRWLAYSSNESGQSEVFVRPFADGKIAGGGRWQVSVGGGATPVWSRGGRRIVFITPDSHVMVTDYTVQNGSFQSGKPRLWAEQRVGSYFLENAAAFGTGPSPIDVAPDGKRLLVWSMPGNVEKPAGNLHVTMVVNWFDDVRRRLP